MQGDYPRFKAAYTLDELVEHFLLHPEERTLVATCRGNANRHGVAVLCKAVQYLGYFPKDFHQVPSEVRLFIAHQLQLLWDHTADYPWHSKSRDTHLALIRQHTSLRQLRLLQGVWSSPGALALSIISLARGTGLPAELRGYAAAARGTKARWECLSAAKRQSTIVDASDSHDGQAYPGLL